ncbi:MAG TPA: RnfABCDGE type electron transport complex subunit G [bacterium]|nr:RnfABCDGE type electron transport complex subunit G [bacterium]
METIKLGVFLMVVCLIAAFGLAMTNRVTEPLIQEQKRLERMEAMKEVLPAATEFEEVANEGGEPAVYNIAKDASGAVIGYAFEAAPKGYGGPVVTMVGIDTGGTVTGIKILSLMETPGLGAKAVEPKFTDQYSGKTIEQLYLKDKDLKKGDIDAITAATITSKAVTLGVREGVEAMQNVLK